jgi:hypothetical protein
MAFVMGIASEFRSPGFPTPPQPREVGDQDNKGWRSRTATLPLSHFP